MNASLSRRSRFHLKYRYNRRPRLATGFSIRKANASRSSYIYIPDAYGDKRYMQLHASKHTEDRCAYNEWVNGLWRTRILAGCESIGIVRL